jgi:hypothetical protein
MSIFVNVSSTWVKTDVKGYASRQDVIEYMEHLYPTRLDDQRGRRVQNYEINVWSLRFGVSDQMTDGRFCRHSRMAIIEYGQSDG